jgi:hypothetical protein
VNNCLKIVDTYRRSSASAFTRSDFLRFFVITNNRRRRGNARPMHLGPDARQVPGHTAEVRMVLAGEGYFVEAEDAVRQHHRMAQPR